VPLVVAFGEHLLAREKKKQRQQQTQQTANDIGTLQLISVRVFSSSVSVNGAKA
jgi:hypothetical protein